MAYEKEIHVSIYQSCIHQSSIYQSVHTYPISSITLKAIDMISDDRSRLQIKDTMARSSSTRTWAMLCKLVYTVVHAHQDNELMSMLGSGRGRVRTIKRSMSTLEAVLGSRVMETDTSDEATTSTDALHCSKIENTCNNTEVIVDGIMGID